MKNKKILLMIAFVSITGLLTACDNSNVSSECNHVWSEYKVTAPTNEKTGIAERTCRLCDESYKVILPVLTDSKYTKTNDTADCTNDGIVTYTYVSDNDGTIKFDVRTSAKGHEYVLVEEVKATENNIHGMKSYYKCANCELIFDLDKNILKDTSSLITNYYESDLYYHWHEESKAKHHYALNGPAINGVQELKCQDCEHVESMQVNKANNVEVSTYLKLAHMTFASEINSTIDLESGISLSATNEKTSSFDGSYLKVGGKINKDSRFIKINVLAKATVTLRIKTGKVQNQTKIGYFNDINNLTDGDKVTGFTELSETTLSPTTPSNITFEIPSAGTYYFGSNDGGFYLNEIKVIYSDDYHKLSDLKYINENKHGYKCLIDGCEMTFLENSHEYDNPTQNEKGEDVYTCKECGYSYVETWLKDHEGHYKRGDENHKIAHTYTDWIKTKEPTYLTEGNEYRTCKICGYIDERNISSLNLGILSTDKDITFTSDSDITISSEYKLNDGVLLVASEDKTSTISKTGYINLGGAVNPNSRYIQIIVDKETKLTVRHASNSKNAETTLALFDQLPNESRDNYLENQIGVATSQSYVSTTFTLSKAGTYYLGSIAGGIRIKSIASEIHTIDYNNWMKDETSHYHGNINCSRHYDEVNHTFDNGTTEGENTKYTCTICGYEKIEVHKWNTTYSSDDNYHWIECSDCDEKKEYSEHTWILDTSKENIHASETNDGVMNYICSICNKQKIEEIPHLELGSAKNGLIKACDVGTIEWQEKIADGCIISGTSQKSITYTKGTLPWAASVTDENKIDYEGYYSFGGGAGGRYIKLNITGKCTIALYGKSNTGTVDIGIADSTSKITGNESLQTISFTSKNNVQMKELTIEEAGTYYLGSVTGGWTFVGMNILYTE